MFNYINVLYKSLPFWLATKMFLLYIFKSILNKDAYLSYSQYGEDIIINYYLCNIKNGFYVDVGCNEPIKRSNTFNLYIRGWRGINIDANKELIEKFRKIRKRDVSVCSAISDTEEKVIFYEFEESALNTFDHNKFKMSKENSSLVKKREIVTERLDSILEKIRIGRNIDFLSIDVEGYDFKVLKSFNFEKYRPRLIVVELHDFDIENFKDSEVVKFLSSWRYKFIGYAAINGYFVDFEFFMK